jgi:membrane protease YdiL (CAAX protease family)
LSVLFAVSLVLCGVRLWTQSLAASTFIHATYNGTIFTILFFATGGFRHLDKIT